MMSAWKRYQPSTSQPWNAQRVAHLHRRIVFGLTSDELDRDVSDTPEHAVNRILQGACRLGSVPNDFETMANLIGQSAADSPNADRLKAWWIYRCLFSPHPLQERLTFMWHNHFATSNLKINSLQLMQRQNQTLREHALAPFEELLTAMLQDCALLEWLDAPSNRKGHSNENLGRELMELFTLGIGNYSEKDIQEAARALTGLNVRDGEYRFEERRHDDTEKTIFGATGKFGVDELRQILLDQPATARRLAWRLTQEFFGEGVVSDAAVDQLANLLRESDLNIELAVETILHSELFFADRNINSRVSDPLSFLLIPLRALEIFDPPPSTLLLSDWLRKMGLDLFYPPNVGGWDGGRTWLNTRTVIARSNYIDSIINGEIHRPAHPPNLVTGIESGSKSSRHETLASLSILMRGTSWNDLEIVADDLSKSVRTMMAQPRANLH